MDAERKIIQSWDTGIKAGAQHDASACATFMARGGEHYLIDMLVVKLEYPELKRRILSHAAIFNPHAVLIEDKASGQSLLQDLKRETALPLIACKAVQDKQTRLLAVTPMMEAGRVHLPKDAPWLAALENELYSFPTAKHDDQVDCISQYLNWVRSAGSKAEMGIRRL